MAMKVLFAVLLAFASTVYGQVDPYAEVGGVEYVPPMHETYPPLPPYDSLPDAYSSVGDTYGPGIGYAPSTGENYPTPPPPPPPPPPPVKYFPGYGTSYDDNDPFALLWADVWTRVWNFKWDIKMIEDYKYEITQGTEKLTSKVGAWCRSKLATN